MEVSPEVFDSLGASRRDIHNLCKVCPDSITARAIVNQVQGVDRPCHVSVILCYSGKPIPCICDHFARIPEKKMSVASSTDVKSDR